jgi:hypothetical protein
VAPVGVLETDDVILPQIAADLHLYEFQRDYTGVFQTVSVARRDIG